MFLSDFPADAETMKRYLEATGVKDMDDLLISDFRIHELYAWSFVENIRNGIKLILTSWNYLATRLRNCLRKTRMSCTVIYWKCISLKVLLT